MTLNHAQDLSLPIERLYTELVDAVASDSRFEGQFTSNLKWAESLFAQREALLNLLTAGRPSSKQALTRLNSRLMLQSRWLFQRLNQFIVLSERDLRRLEVLVSDWLEALRGAVLEAKSAVECLELLEPFSARHVRELATLLARSAHPDIRIRSEEYSAETQLEVLRLQTTTLAPPVLDIGCGRDAALVKWFRSKNINAVGFDLFDSATLGCLLADWFEFPFMPEQFGTVIAHLSFSLHFLHQHLRPDGDAKRYALQYMTILRSVKHGGCFAYTPGLPFIEVLLPSDQYTVMKYEMDSLPIDEQAMGIFAQGLGESPIYACHVVRR